jgi:molecular chaperone IbpA
MGYGIPNDSCLLRRKTMNQLVRFDTNALNRALIGFDRLFNDFENRSQTSTNNYPPYNVIKHDEDSFEIEIAVAGFDRNDITIEVDQDRLVIKGARQKDDDSSKYLHRGLAARDFERIFNLAEHIIVGDAELTNGILSVKLTREVPEALKPRLIAIK